MSILIMAESNPDKRKEMTMAADVHFYRNRAKEWDGRNERRRCVGRLDQSKGELTGSGKLHGQMDDPRFRVCAGPEAEFAENLQHGGVFG
jgi:hypothetical protein